MQRIDEWLIEQHIGQGPYNRSIHGKEFEPRTLAQAEGQLNWLATMIRTSFGRDPRFDRATVKKATDLIEQAANLLGNDLDMRNIEWGQGDPQNKQP